MDFNTLSVVAGKFDRIYRNKVPLSIKTKIQNDLIIWMEREREHYAHVMSCPYIDKLPANFYSQELVIAIFKFTPRILENKTLPITFLTSEAFEIALRYYYRQYVTSLRFDFGEAHALARIFEMTSKFPIESQTPLLLACVKSLLRKSKNRYLSKKVDANKYDYMYFLNLLQLPQEGRPVLPQDEWWAREDGPFVPKYRGPYLQEFRKLGTDAFKELESQQD